MRGSTAPFDLISQTLAGLCFFRPDRKADAANGVGNRQAISANHVYSAFSPAGEAAKLADYRICVVGIGGHYTEEIFLECPDDNAAKETASQWVDGHDVELWQHGRLVAKFISKPK